MMKIVTSEDIRKSTDAERVKILLGIVKGELIYLQT